LCPLIKNEHIILLHQMRLRRKHMIFFPIFLINRLGIA